MGFKRLDVLLEFKYWVNQMQETCPTHCTLSNQLFFLNVKWKETVS